MSKYTIYVCGNDETLLDGTYLGRGGVDSREEAAEIVRAGCAVIDDDPRADAKVESQFRDWHGGRFCQFYKEGKHGWVVCEDDAPKWVHSLAGAASDAMEAERVRADDLAEQSDREFFAGEIEAGAEVEGFRFDIENYLLGVSVTNCTPDSVSAALRANDAKLLVVLV